MSEIFNIKDEARKEIFILYEGKQILSQLKAEFTIIASRNLRIAYNRGRQTD